MLALASRIEQELSARIDDHDMSFRVLYISVAVLISAAGMAADTKQRLDFDLLNEPVAISATPADPRPGTNEVLLLQFWASWCHSCASLMWDMDELVSQNAGVNYIAVSLDDEFSDAKDYIIKHKLYDKYSDRYFVDSDKRLSVSLGVETVPSIMLVDGDGNILVRKAGHLNGADLRDFVTAIRTASHNN